MNFVISGSREFSTLLGIMNIIFWNCGGLGNLRIIQALCGIIQQQDPHIAFLSESKCNVSLLRKLKFQLGFDHVFVVNSRGQSRGLAMFWRVEVPLRIISSSSHHIDCEIRGISDLEH